MFFTNEGNGSEIFVNVCKTESRPCLLIRMQRSQDHIRVLGAGVTNQNAIDEEIKIMLNPKTAALIRCSIFCPQVYSPNIKDLNIKEYNFPSFV
jgi:hypothetical protein